MSSQDTGLTSGTNLFMQQLAGIQSNGPIAYTTYDFLKAFSGIISMIKFVAHIFSLPLMVFLRKDQGVRYLDPIHISLAFIIWTTIGMFSTGLGVVFGQLASPMITIFGWLFVPFAIWHRRRAKRAAFAFERYSYDAGLSHLAAFALPLVKKFAGTRNLTPDAITGLVRKWVDPLAVFLIGLICIIVGFSGGFGYFLIWTAILLHVDESLSQRCQLELFFDMVDSQVLAQEKSRLLSGDGTGDAAPSVASVAAVRGLTQPLPTTS